MCDDYETAVDDFLTGDINLLSPANILYFISKFGLSPLENVAVMDIKKMREERSQEASPF